MHWVIMDAEGKFLSEDIALGQAHLLACPSGAIYANAHLRREPEARRKAYYEATKVYASWPPGSALAQNLRAMVRYLQRQDDLPCAVEDMLVAAQAALDMRDRQGEPL